MMARSLQAIAPYSYYVRQQLLTDSQAFNAGFTIFLWPIEGLAIFGIWTCWASALKPSWRWWWDIAPTLITGLMMIGIFPDSSYLGALISGYMDCGAVAAALLAFWAFRAWAGPVGAWR